MSKKLDGLELEQHLDFQRKYWKVQKFLWVFVILFLIAAFIGLLGGQGPLAQQTQVSEDSSLAVRYPAYERWKASSGLSIRAKATGVDKVTIAINRDYMEALQVQSVVPEPESVTVGENQVLYTFNSHPQAKGDLLITFDLIYEDFGKLTGTFKYIDHGTVEVKQLIYP